MRKEHWVYMMRDIHESSPRHSFGQSWEGHSRMNPHTCVNSPIKKMCVIILQREQMEDRTAEKAEEDYRPSAISPQGN